MKRLWTLSCIMVLAMVSLASAQITWDFAGGGARAEGMGKAYYGISDDATAVTWNPAGLVGQERPILGLSYGTIRPRGSFSLGGDKFNQTGSFQNITNASFLAPVRVRGHQFVLSAAYSQVVEDYSFVEADIRDDDIPNEWSPETTYDLQILYKGSAHYNPYTINFGFGTKILQALDMGLAINIYTGRAVRSDRIDYYMFGYRPLDRLIQPVTSDSSISSLDTTKYSGVNFTFGFKYTATRLTAGLVLKSGYSLNALRDIKISDSVRYNNQVKRGITVYLDDQLIKYEIPWTVGAGIGYKLRDNWLVAADAEYRPYSGKVLKVRTSINIGSGGNKEEVFEEIDPQWYNAFAFRAGTEYQWKAGSRFFPLVPVRAGFAVVPAPTPALNLSGSTSKTTMYNLTFGTGVYWSQIHLDLAYVLSLHDLDVASALPGPYGQMYLLVGEESNRTHRLNLSFTGYF